MKALSTWRMGRWTGGVVFVAIGVGAVSAFAQTTNDVSVAAPVDASPVTGFFINLSQQHPWIASVLLVIGAFRVLFKPVMALIEKYVRDNCSADEYARLQQFEAGPVYKWISFGLDFVGSIKVPMIQSLKK